MTRPARRGHPSGEQTFEITVPLEASTWTPRTLWTSSSSASTAATGALHVQHPVQEAVLVNARVAVIGLLPSLPAEREQESASGAEAKPKSRRAYLGRWVEVPVYDLDARLRPGLEVKGPAIFESSTTTVVLRQDERATVLPLGWLDIALR